MAKLHDNTEFDADAEAVAFVERLEREALDEDQVIGACNRVMEILGSRAQAATESIKADLSARIIDGRRAKVKAGIKGVKPMPFGDQKVQLAGAPVIPMKAVR
jgi:hypothetical protein